MNMSPFAPGSNANRWEQAINKYTDAIADTPEDANAYLQRGLAYRMLGRFEQAVADYTRAIELDPHNHLAYSYRAVVYMKLYKTDLAAADTARAKALLPPGTDARNVVYDYEDNVCFQARKFGLLVLSALAV